jgi:GNAT superfamily N-acetyltransferase
MQNMQFEARLAGQSDLRVITRLCRRAVGPRDYVLYILTETIKANGLFLAYCQRELVGITNLEQCIDGSGWLNMARTDPVWRRKGVALFLQQQIVEHARSRGIRKLRLWASFRNRPSINAIRKGGFKLVCEAVHISSHFRLHERQSRISPLSTASETELDSLLRSKHISDMNGYIAYKRHFVRADKPLLKLLLQKRELYRVGDEVFILTNSRRVSGEYQTNLALLTGAVTRSFRVSKEIANNLGTKHVAAYVPRNRYVLRTAREFGFKSESWGEHCLVFEKSIAR